jgi:pimeloyl-ACP methyl ester carboxylesterase
VVHHSVEIKEGECLPRNDEQPKGIPHEENFRDSTKSNFLQSSLKNNLIGWGLSLVLALTPFAGAWAADESGSFYINEALVHYLRPENGRQGVSVVMIPGLNLSSYIYLTTPDGRPGWAQEFADDGYDVYVINDPDFDFSRGFSVAPFTNVPTAGAPPADPSATQGWQQDIWRRWGFGSSEGNPYPDTRFPTAYFGAFALNYPYLRSVGASYPDAIIALLDQIGPSLLMAHSAGGPQAVSAAKARPNLVPALILIEPTSPPDTNDFPALSGMSLIGVYGDYIDSRNQGNRKIATEAAAALHVQNGGRGEVISLPEELGIFGNTHLMMQDDNNAFIADLILDWLAANVETRAFPPKIGIAAEGGLISLTSRVEGLWQSSTNLVTWTNLSPVPTRGLLVPRSGAAMFFRQVD